MKRRSLLPNKKQQSPTENDPVHQKLEALRAENAALRKELKQLRLSAEADLRLEIDVDARVGRLIGPQNKPMTIKGKWIEFFAILLLKSSQADFTQRHLTASELNTIGEWSHYDDELDVGKEVSRFLKRKLKEEGLQNAIESTDVTISWRLGANVVTNPFSLDDVTRFLRSRGWEQSSIQSRLTLPQFVDWAAKATNALMLLQDGKVEQAQISMKQLIDHQPHDPFLSRIARIQHIRAIQRAGDADDKERLREYDEDHTWGAGTWGRSFRARALALKKHWVRPEDYNQEIANIRELLAYAESAGDMGGAGILHGTLAVLCRRVGRYNDAEAALRRAIPLLLANGDVLNLQGALFNLGHLVERMIKVQGKYSYDVALSALQLDMELRDKFKFGRDSAQCEILISLILADMNPHDTRADDYLEKAKELLASNNSAYDEACWYRARAKLLYRRTVSDDTQPTQEQRGEIIELLRKAVSWFEKANRPAEKLDTQKKLDLFQRKGHVWS